MITSQDIYDFYWLWWVHQNNPGALQTQYGEYIAGERAGKLRNKYLKIFKGLMAEQIEKYIGGRRIDPDFDRSGISPDEPASVLWHKMEKTFRSDMKRRNTVWNLVGQYTTGLEESSDLNSVFLHLDRLNSCVHNTETSILGKLANGYELTRVYDTVAGKDPHYWQQFVSKDLRQLLST